MELGTMLAALDNNKNCDRKQKQTITSNTNNKVTFKSHFRVAWRKPSKKYIARRFYDPKNYDYLLDMMQRVKDRAAARQLSKSPTKKRCMAPSNGPDKKELIEKATKHTRF